VVFTSVKERFRIDLLTEIFEVAVK
jgi:hypothetical protein